MPDALAAMTEEQARAFARDAITDPWAEVVPITAAELLARDIPPRRLLLDPWLPEAGSAMVYAPRGVGKTFFALSLAWAVASGGGFLRWRAPTPRPVLYVDGEMPLALLQERLAAIVAGAERRELPHEGFFRFLAADAHTCGLPDMEGQDGAALLERCREEAALLVMDNLSTLVGGRENEGDDWRPMQGRVLALRRVGVSVLLIHHAGRNGNARGTSRREDVLDTVVKLDRPEDHDPAEGARFVVRFEKSRGFSGPDAAALEATMEVGEDGAAGWRWAEAAPGKRVLAREMFAAGEKVAAVMQALEVSKATAYRWHKDWLEGRA